MQGGGLMV